MEEVVLGGRGLGITMVVVVLMFNRWIEMTMLPIAQSLD